MGSEFTKLLDLAVQKGHKASSLLTEIQKKILALYVSEHSQVRNIQINIDSITGRVRIYQNNTDITESTFQQKAESLAREHLVNVISEASDELQIPVPSASAQSQQAVQPQAQQIAPTQDKPNMPIPQLTSILQQPIQVQTVSKPFAGLWNRLRAFTLSTRLVKMLFWTYHILVLLVIYVAIFSIGDSEFRNNLFDSISGTFSVKSAMLLLSLAIPLASLWHTSRKKIIADGEKLKQFFFALEIPLLTITLSAYLLDISSIAHLAVYVGLMLMPILLYMDSHKNSGFATETEGATVASHHQSHILKTVQHYAFVTSAYIALIYTFYVPSIASKITSGLFLWMSLWNSSRGYYPYNDSLGFGDIFSQIVYLCIIIITIIMALMPYMMLILAGKKFTKVDTQDVKLSQLTHLFLSAVIFVALVFGTSSFMPESKVYRDLTKFINSTNYEERAMIAKEAQANKELYSSITLNYNNSHFYLTEPMLFFYTPLERLTLVVKPAFKYLARPFLRPTANHEVQNALYQIFPPEYSIHSESMQSPAMVQSDTRKYSVSLDKSEPLAKVTFDESYVSNSTTDQEVIYEFILPDDAVVTDLKLGPDLEYQGIIAPRGAAETTYRSQIAVRRDPALLEQIGPRTYRLRVYPIPSRNSSVLQGRSQRVAFTYTTGLSTYGVGLPEFMPTTAFKISTPQSQIFEFEGKVATNESQRSSYFSNGTIVDKAKTFCNSNTSKDSLSALSTAGINCSGSKYTFSGKGKKIALIFDTTLNSNDALYQSLKNQLKENSSFLDNNQVDLYLYEFTLSKPISLKTGTLDSLPEVTYFNSSNHGSMSASFQRHITELTNKNYDAIISLQKTNYYSKLYANKIKSTIPLVILNNANITFNSMNYAEYLRIKMYFVDDVADAFKYVSILKDKAPNNGVLISDSFYMTNGTTDFSKIQVPTMTPIPTPTAIPVPTFYFEPVNQSDQDFVQPIAPIEETQLVEKVPEKPVYLQTREPINNLEALKGSLLIDGYLLNDPGNTPSFASLDNINSLAQKYNIVSPYSSYLALVNDEQMQILYNEIQKQSRYDSNTRSANLPPAPMQTGQSIPGPSINSGESFPDMLSMTSRSLYGKSMSNVGGGGQTGDILVNESDLSFQIPSFSSIALNLFVMFNLGLVGFTLLGYILKLRKKKSIVN